MMTKTLAPAGRHSLGSWPPACPQWVANLADLPDAPLIPTDRPESLKRMAYPEDHMPQEVIDFKAGNWDSFLAGLEDVEFCLSHEIPTFFGSWYMRKITAEGEVLDLGLHS